MDIKNKSKIIQKTRVYFNVKMAYFLEGLQSEIGKGMERIRMNKEGKNPCTMVSEA